MDIGGYHRAIHPGFEAFLDLFVLSMGYDAPIDRLPSLG
jgi:hypothetical protein